MMPAPATPSAAPSLVGFSLQRWLEERGAYESYVYSYPHKTAYRPFDAPIPLRELWQAERRDALFLYMHVPFCEMRCGFCNLFTQVRPSEELSRAYVASLERQAGRVRAALGTDACFVRVAFGGGTPSFLEPALLARIFDVAEIGMGASLRALPSSFETSPATATTERLALVAERGIDRISIGVQSFFDSELKAIGRPASVHSGEAALDRIRAAGFATLNVDLIYGIGGQTIESWLHSVRTALRWQPEELYLYPLYVRPLTGLGRNGMPWDDQRLACYRGARALLLDAGYQQVSMRMFRRRDAGVTDGPVYCCQEDGMVGLGCGARSYTTALHYSDEWAVTARGVGGIVSEWVRRPTASFDDAWYGHRLSPLDQRIRYLLQSLLQTTGLDIAAYRRRFDSEPFDDLPELAELVEEGMAVHAGECVTLAPRGLELSDSIGPWLYSDNVVAAMRGYVLR